MAETVYDEAHLLPNSNQNWTGLLVAVAACAVVLVEKPGLADTQLVGFVSRLAWAQGPKAHLLLNSNQNWTGPLLAFAACSAVLIEEPVLVDTQLVGSVSKLAWA